MSVSSSTHSQPGAASFATRIRRVPTVLQMESSECGAASLGMVLASHGAWVSLDELRVACNVSRDGAEAADVVRAARRYGMDARGMRCETEALAGFDMPVILFWEFRHFVVLEGGSAKGAWINDPAVGRRLVSWQDFDLSFTGIALLMSPGQDFRPVGTRPSVARESWAVMSRTSRGLLFGLATSVLSAACCVAIPLLVRSMVDHTLASSGSDDGFRGAVATLLLVLGLSLVAVTWARDSALLASTLRLSYSMGRELFDHMIRLPASYFRQRHHGVLAGRFRANDDLADMFARRTSVALADALAVLATCALGFYLYWPVALGQCVLLIIAGAIFTATARRSGSSAARAAVAEAQLFVIGATLMHGIETVKANGEEGGLFKRWSGSLATGANVSRRAMEVRSLSSMVSIWCASGCALVIALFGGRAMVDGDVSAGTLVALQMVVAASWFAVARLFRVGSEVSALQTILAQRRDVFVGAEPLEAPSVFTTKDVDPVDALALSESVGFENPDRVDDQIRLAGSLEVRDISFGFDLGRPPLLADIDFAIRPGECVAIVGSSGSGKSTLARVLAGLYVPWIGSVLLDGRARNLWSPDTVRASVAFVEQNALLIGGSVRENLSLWDPTRSDEDLIRAARDAEIYRDIVARSGGLDQMIIDDGVDWSGGQRQRLELARALATDPSILILDEATAALDTVVERKIYANLRARGCTLVVVAHRLSSIRDADRIIVLDAGRVAESGSHAELLARGGIYSELVRDDDQ